MKRLIFAFAISLLIFSILPAFGWLNGASSSIRPIDLPREGHRRYPIEPPLSTPPATPVVWSQPQSAAFHEDFDGDPSTPLAWQDENWDITVHSRSFQYLYQMAPMMAAHGPNCEPPPENHSANTYQDAVFQCKNHLMTAINDPGYGVIYLTPNVLVDFSAGEAVIRFNVSTQRSSQRDWIDLWISPFEDHLQLPLENYLPDLSGEPQDAVHIRMEFTPSSFKGFIIRDFEVYEIPGTNSAWQGYETFLTPDERRRDTFELQISQDHIRFGMPDYDFDWIDTPIPHLNWDKGVVQLGHHSYNPTKCEKCSPNTWHWDNIFIEPSVPFSMIHANQRYVDASSNPVITFNHRAPTNAYLRFSAIGESIEVSFNGGSNWQEARVQPQVKFDEDKFWSYWMAVPLGVDQVSFRGEDWWGGKWHVRDISIWSQDIR